MMPRLSILALCYQHAPYLEEALASIAALDYPNLEVWIADDASRDHSVEILKIWQTKKPEWHFVFNEQNLGNCKTFNTLLQQCTGDFVLDFATDDRLIPQKIKAWTAHFSQFPEAGFCYADAEIISATGQFSYVFSERIVNLRFPEGPILNELMAPHFICPPAVLFRRSALVSVGGYDASLHYEDWDTWLRLARQFPACRFGEPVIQYRQHRQSMSASIVAGRNKKHLASTLLILQKIDLWSDLEKSEKWEKFVRYHLKICSMLQFPDLCQSLFQLLQGHKKARLSDRALLLISRLPLPIHLLFRWWKGGGRI